MRRTDTRSDRRWNRGWPPGGPWDAPFPQRGRGRGRGGGHRRRSRGNIRAAVLGLLNERPMHGYEIIQELDTRTSGMWRPSPGSIYPTLQLLEDEGLITSEKEAGRRSFSLTDAGREEAARAAEKPPWSEYADEDTVSELHNFRQASWGIMNALREVGTAGTDDQRARALQVLNDTRRRLYAILAEAEPSDE